MRFPEKRPHGNTTFTTTTVARNLDGEPWAVSLDPRHQTETEQHQHGKRSRPYSRSRGEFSNAERHQMETQICPKRQSQIVGGVYNPTASYFCGSGL
ncbi:hypothetical protein J4G08_06375 [Candidatus Poribacteria bacterium]|nr:hypothetical protein [Candidatus Poribacteria bacterium]